ncbi:Pro-Pol polyprotein [Bienertia sinuspersici]
MEADSMELVWKCQKCQRFAPTIHRPANDLQPILNPIPFAQWGMDILGPFPRAPGGKRWLIVGIDYFSKWIEAESLVQITRKEVRKFIWQNIMTCYSLLVCLVFDHGKQFDNDDIKEFLSQYHVKFASSAVCHPQSNGLAEAANKKILNSLLKRLEDKKGKRLFELHNTLWSLKTTRRESTWQTPFCMVYGTEALMPIEAGSTSLRVQRYHGAENDRVLAERLDVLEEVREQAALRMQAYLGKVARH